MSTTHGGRQKNFEWQLVGKDIFIKNEDGRVHLYSLSEIYQIIQWLRRKFGNDWFPLANNVESMGSGEEKDGLGMAILNSSPDDITHAQGSSYLGVVLDEVSIFQWNGAKRGIHWRVAKMPESISQLEQIIKCQLSGK